MKLPKILTRGRHLKQAGRGGTALPDLPPSAPKRQSQFIHVPVTGANKEKFTF